MWKSKSYPKISVILPTHNRANLIGKTIRSVLEQRFQNWELIIIDDGSTDHTLEAIDHFLQDTRIFCYGFPNMGAAIARNVGIGLATADWIAFLDSDDYWLPGKLEKDWFAIKRNGDKVTCFYSGYVFEDSETGKQYKTKIYRRSGPVFPEILVTNVVGALPTFVAPRKILLETGFDSRFKSRQDVDLYVRLAQRCRFHYIDSFQCVITKGNSNQITKNAYNRLAGFKQFYLKYKEIMTYAQRSFNAKRILYYALKTRSLTDIFLFLPISLFSIIKGKISGVREEKVKAIKPFEYQE